MAEHSVFDSPARASEVVKTGLTKIPRHCVIISAGVLVSQLLSPLVIPDNLFSELLDG